MTAPGGTASLNLGVKKDVFVLCFLFTWNIKGVVAEEKLRLLPM